MRRDVEHVDNAGEKYNQEYSYYSEVDEEPANRNKQFIRHLQNATGATQSRIVGGEEVVPHSIPWQVSIRYK